MPRNYIPKRSFFESTRIHKIAKEIIRDCSEDRQRALDTFDYFKSLVSTNPEDDKSKSEMVHALSLSQDSTDNVVKILDMMIKMTQNEQKIDAQDLKPVEEWSFEELRKGG